ncbi:unnamed protein product [Adineta steineri]|uniref:Uncharacterized protein n=1 Tax=Adineta steineri TaxID=433720 RepID=A0A819PP96_9BILA|nr:unnamed protein product [Adineta steineri]
MTTSSTTTSTTSSTSSSSITSTTSSSSTTSSTSSSSTASSTSTTTTTETTITFTPSGIYALKIPTCATWNQTGITVAGNANGTAGSDLGSLRGPVSIFVDNNNTLYVCDRSNNRIMKYYANTNTGIVVAGNLTAGNSSSQLKLPKGVAVDQYGAIIVADSSNYRIQRFPFGSTVATTIAKNSSSNLLGQIRDLHIDVNNNIYVTDSDYNQIVKYYPNSGIGVILAPTNGAGSGADQVNAPFGNFVDGNQTLYIADSGNQRVQMWAVGATSGVTIAGVAGVAGSNLTLLNNPNAVIVDNNGYIYVADGNNDRIVKWTTNYTAGGICVVGCTGSTGVANNQFNGVRDLKFDTQGNLYVTDQQNYRIQKFMIQLPTSGCPTTSSEKIDELYRYLMLNYNKYVRPVENSSHRLTVKVGVKLIQIDDVNEINQIMQTHVYVLHEWKDFSFVWSPDDFDGIEYIYMPNNLIWKPDLVLYNNADGDYQITSKAKAYIQYDGTVRWNPPMIYKSYCSIDMQYYPYDTQNCTLKFGTWTYPDSLVNLQFLTDNHSSVIDRGWDLEDYTPSVEWEILNLKAIRHEKVYAYVKEEKEKYLDLTFTCTIQRKSLFYTINLIVPCINISVLTVLVFVLPSDSRKKITLSVSILVALLVFYLLLIELIPSTSLVISLLGKYLLFTLILVNLSIAITVITLNIHFRRHPTTDMPSWLRNTLLIYLPKLLFMKRPSLPTKYVHIREQLNSIHPHQFLLYQFKDKQRKHLVKIISNHIAYIVRQIENEKNEKEIIEEWRFIALILDRLFLIIFVSITLIGTIESLFNTPSLYISTPPINPMCYLYYPPINDSQWIKICATDSLSNQ